MFRKMIIAGFGRAWLGFAAIFVLGGATFMLIDGDDPLRSDDPYVMGYAIGVFAAVMGVVYSIAESACGHRFRTSLIYFALVAAWAAFFIAITAHGNEGAELGRFLAIAHAASAVVCWPIFAFRLPKAVVLAISVAGASALVMYAIVAARMAERSADAARPMPVPAVTAGGSPAHGGWSARSRVARATRRPNDVGTTHARYTGIAERSWWRVMAASMNPAKSGCGVSGFERNSVLRGTIRDHGTGDRRAYLRYFACEEDVSHEPPETPLPEAVAEGREPFFVIGAISGG